MSKAEQIIAEIKHLKAKLVEFDNFTGKTYSICIEGDRSDISLHDIDISGEVFATIRGHMRDAIEKEIQCLEINYYQL
jgi:hypothetical protein